MEFKFKMAIFMLLALTNSARGTWTPNVWPSANYPPFAVGGRQVAADAWRNDTYGRFCTYATEMNGYEVTVPSTYDGIRIVNDAFHAEPILAWMRANFLTLIVPNALITEPAVGWTNWFNGHVDVDGYNWNVGSVCGYPDMVLSDVVTVPRYTNTTFKKWTVAEFMTAVSNLNPNFPSDYFTPRKWTALDPSTNRPRFKLNTSIYGWDNMKLALGLCRKMSKAGTWVNGAYHLQVKAFCYISWYYGGGVTGDGCETPNPVCPSATFPLRDMDEEDPLCTFLGYVMGYGWCYDDITYGDWWTPARSRTLIIPELPHRQSAGQGVQVYAATPQYTRIRSSGYYNVSLWIQLQNACTEVGPMYMKEFGIIISGQSKSYARIFDENTMPASPILEQWFNPVILIDMSPTD